MKPSFSFNINVIYYNSATYSVFDNYTCHRLILTTDTSACYEETSPRLTG